MSIQIRNIKIKSLIFSHRVACCVGQRVSIMSKNLAVFYHIWSPDGTDLWKFIVDEQIKRLLKSELTAESKVFCTISGAQAEKIKRFVSLYDFITIMDVTTNEEKYEGLTLEKLFESAISDSNFDAYLYFHTKGISHMSGLSPLCNVPGISSDRMFRSVNSWRNELEWGVIDKWRDAVAKLDECDVAGVN